MDIRLALMAGNDIPIPEIQITLHQPTIAEIAYLGEEDFFTAIQYLCLEKEQFIEDKTLLNSFTNFQVLMKIIQQLGTSDRKNAILNLLSLLFPNCKSIITPNSIILNNTEANNMTIIDENNFSILQNVIKEVLCVNSIFQGDNIVYNPGNAAAKKIADKIMKGRKKVAELKGSNTESILSRYVSILAVGMNSMSLRDCLQLTMYQLFDLMERYQLFVAWDIDLRSRLAGGKPESEVENWMKNIH